jgi:hypothetical protein
MCVPRWGRRAPRAAASPLFGATRPPYPLPPLFTRAAPAQATHDFSYTEFRARGSPPIREATNWTELYHTGEDPWQGTNLATAPVPAFADELWRYAACEKGSCP